MTVTLSQAVSDFYCSPARCSQSPGQTRTPYGCSQRSCSASRPFTQAHSRTREHAEHVCSTRQRLYASKEFAAKNDAKTQSTHMRSREYAYGIYFTETKRTTKIYDDVKGCAEVLTLTAPWALPKGKRVGEFYFCRVLLCNHNRLAQRRAY